jgi:YD repeat-containing protein
VSSETTPAGTASYTYDSADRPATVADPLTGASLSYGYNANYSSADCKPSSQRHVPEGASRRPPSGPEPL